MPPTRRNKNRRRASYAKKQRTRRVQRGGEGGIFGAVGRFFARAKNDLDGGGPWGADSVAEKLRPIGAYTNTGLLMLNNLSSDTLDHFISIESKYRLNPIHQLSINLFDIEGATLSAHDWASKYELDVIAGKRPRIDLRDEETVTYQRESINLHDEEALKLTDAEWVGKLTPVLSGLVHLVHLDLQRAPVGLQDMGAFMEALPKTLKLLSLSGTNFLRNAANARHFAKVLPTLTSLETLDISYNNFPGDTFLTIFNAMSTADADQLSPLDVLNNLKLLKIRNSTININDSTLRALNAKQPSSQLGSLKALDLSHTPLDPLVVVAILQLIRANALEIVSLQETFFNYFRNVPQPEDIVERVEADFDEVGRALNHLHKLRRLGLRTERDPQFRSDVDVKKQIYAYVLYILEQNMEELCGDARKRGPESCGFFSGDTLPIYY